MFSFSLRLQRDQEENRLDFLTKPIIKFSIKGRFCTHHFTAQTVDLAVKVGRDARLRGDVGHASNGLREEGVAESRPRRRLGGRREGRLRGLMADAAALADGVARSHNQHCEYGWKGELERKLQQKAEAERANEGGVSAKVALIRFRPSQQEDTAWPVTKK